MNEAQRGVCAGASSSQRAGDSTSLGLADLGCDCLGVGMCPRRHDGARRPDVRDLAVRSKPAHTAKQPRRAS
jgi:hypothetical protein